MDYAKLKRTTIRGARIKKIIAFIEQYYYIKGTPTLVLEDLGLSPEKQAEWEIEFYTTQKCCRVLSEYINSNFETSKYDEEEFSKKIFSGAKIVSFLEFLDFFISSSENEINHLKNNGIRLFLNQRYTNLLLLQAQIEIDVYKEMKHWIIYGASNSRNTELMEQQWIEDLAKRIDSED